MKNRRKSNLTFESGVSRVIALVFCLYGAMAQEPAVSAGSGAVEPPPARAQVNSVVQAQFQAQIQTEVPTHSLVARTARAAPANCDLSADNSGVTSLAPLKNPDSKLANSLLEDETQIRALLETQAKAWNRGDIESFVDGYWRSEETVFVGASGVKRGWQSILERYRRAYPDRKAMGQLSFTDLEVHLTGADSAYAIGQFHLLREVDNKPDERSGFFTLYLRKFSGHWLIVADHTTAKAN